MAHISVMNKAAVLGRILFLGMRYLKSVGVQSAKQESVPVTGLLNFLRAALIAWSRNLPITDFVTAALIRTFLTCFTPEQIVAICPGFEQTYREWLKKTPHLSSVAPRPLICPRSISKQPHDTPFAHLKWISGGQKTANKVILFFHGGGYNAPLSVGHLRICEKLLEAASSVQYPPAIAILEYGLTPAHRYPQQLLQANDALKEILCRGFSPPNIVIGGDSAGANLALALLSHLMHKNPAVPVLELDSPLAGVFLLSPWVSADMTAKSFSENGNIDMLSSAQVMRSTNDFVCRQTIRKHQSGAAGWVFALDADVQWWDTLGLVVQNIYITAGQHEIFRDDIVAFHNVLLSRVDGAKGPKIELHVGQGEAHDHILLLELRQSLYNHALERLCNWYRAILDST